MLRLESWRLRLLGRSAISIRRGTRADADALIYSFAREQFSDPAFAARETAAIKADAAPIKIFLLLIAPAVHGAAREETDRINRTIDAMARECGAQTVLTADLMHTGVARRVKANGTPNLYGYLAMAHVILRAMIAQSLRRTAQGSRDASAPRADEALAHLVWPHPHLPANFASNYDREHVEDLLDGVASFLGYRAWGKVRLGEPVDWTQAGPNLSWRSYFNGFDFLKPSLAFSFDWAADPRGKSQSGIAAALAARGKTPNDSLFACGRVIADFARNNAPDAPANQRAYAEGTISRRARVLMTYLVCAKRAAENGSPMPDKHVAGAWTALVHALNMLATDELYPAAGNHGVRQDVVLILFAALFPQLEFAQAFARSGLERLEKQQLRRALSKDGVWLENSFGYHCIVMNMLIALAADLRDCGAPAAHEIHDVLERMCPFVEGLMKTDGASPLIGDTAPRNALPTLAGARGELACARGEIAAPVDIRSFVRTRETFYFPDAGYFASHSARELAADGSSVIFFANLSTPKHKQSDDLSLIFSRGPRDLLIDGGTYNKEVSDTVRNAARFDPASHNSFRIDGKGYNLRAIKGMKPAGLDGMWEGEGWAASTGHNSAYEGGRIVRTVVHLKKHHALIVLDRLSAKGAGATFEQFWHLAPDLASATPDESAHWLFTSAAGNLRAAFDAPVRLEHGGPDNPIAYLMTGDSETVPTPYLRRELRAKDGIMASMFQSTKHSGELAVTVARARGGHELTARGIAFAARFRIGEKSVECLELT